MPNQSSEAGDRPGYNSSLSETLLHDFPLRDTWDIFSGYLGRLGLETEELDQFTAEFARVLHVARAFNQGEFLENAPYEFQKNSLRYHNWDHVPQVVEQVLRIFPKYLDDQLAAGSGGDIRSLMPYVKGVIFAAVNHEIGYLLRARGDEVYQAQGELYFDHVDRGMEFAPGVIRFALGLPPDDPLNDFGGEDFIRLMIRATDFNRNWDEKAQEGLVGDVGDYGKILEAADFIGPFADEDNIPQNVSDLYWENLSPVRMNGIIQKFARKPDGTIRTELIPGSRNGPRYRPVLVDAGPDDDEYATIQEVKFYAPIDRPDKEIYEVVPKTLYNFVSSEFLSGLKGALDPYLTYIDYFFDPSGDRDRNEVRRLYDENILRIELLRQLIDVPETDPFSIFEGAFTGHDLLKWTGRMQRHGILDPAYSRDWCAVDRRILGFNQTEGTVLDRLATDEVRDILHALDKKHHALALSFLLDGFREKMRGEHVAEVYLNVAPGAYTKAEGGPFEDVGQSLDVFLEAFSMMGEDEQLPKLRFVFTVRRDKDCTTDGLPDEGKMNALAGLINSYYNGDTGLGGVTGVSFLGTENEPLWNFDEFFNSLRRDMPFILLTGQTFPDDARTQGRIQTALRLEIFQGNVFYLQELAQKFENLVVWGLQDLHYITNKDTQAEMKEALKNRRLKFLLTLTFDAITNLVPDIKDHPIHGYLPPEAAIYYATGNPAYAGFGSVALDALLDLLTRGQDKILPEVVGNNSFYTPSW